MTAPMNNTPDDRALALDDFNSHRPWKDSEHTEIYCDDLLKEETCKTIRKALETPAPVWLPIESAPKDGTRILLFAKTLICGYWTDWPFGNSGWNHGGIPIANPIAWMSLPTPPELKD